MADAVHPNQTGSFDPKSSSSSNRDTVYQSPKTSSSPENLKHYNEASLADISNYVINQDFFDDSVGEQTSKSIIFPILKTEYYDNNGVSTRHLKLDDTEEYTTSSISSIFAATSIDSGFSPISSGGQGEQSTVTVQAFSPKNAPDTDGNNTAVNNINGNNSNNDKNINTSAGSIISPLIGKDSYSTLGANLPFYPRYVTSPTCNDQMNDGVNQRSQDYQNGSLHKSFDIINDNKLGYNNNLNPLTSNQGIGANTNASLEGSSLSSPDILCINGTEISSLRYLESKTNLESDRPYSTSTSVDESSGIPFGRSSSITNPINYHEYDGNLKRQYQYHQQQQREQYQHQYQYQRLPRRQQYQTQSCQQKQEQQQNQWELQDHISQWKDQSNANRSHPLQQNNQRSSDRQSSQQHQKHQQSQDSRNFISPVNNSRLNGSIRSTSLNNSGPFVNNFHNTSYNSNNNIKNGSRGCASFHPTVDQAVPSNYDCSAQYANMHDFVNQTNSETENMAGNENGIDPAKFRYLALADSRNINDIYDLEALRPVLERQGIFLSDHLLSRSQGLNPNGASPAAVVEPNVESIPTDHSRASSNMHNGGATISNMEPENEETLLQNQANSISALLDEKDQEISDLKDEIAKLMGTGEDLLPESMPDASTIYPSPELKIYERLNLSEIDCMGINQLRGTLKKIFCYLDTNNSSLKDRLAALKMQKNNAQVLSKFVVDLHLILYGHEGIRPSPNTAANEACLEKTLVLVKDIVTNHPGPREH